MQIGVRQPVSPEEKARRVAKAAETRARNKRLGEERACARELELEEHSAALKERLKSVLLSDEDVLAHLQITSTELRALCKSGQLAFIQFGRSRGIFSREVVEAFQRKRAQLRAQMLQAACGIPYQLFGPAEDRVPWDGRAARVLESDALAPAVLDEAAVALVSARYQCSPRYALRRLLRSNYRSETQYAHRGWVYALQCGGSGLIKIGRTDNENAWPRLKSLIDMSGAPLRLLGLAHGAFHEKTFHSIYAERRRHGEWFELNENPLPNRRECATCRMTRWDPYGK